MIWWLSWVSLAMTAGLAWALYSIGDNWWLTAILTFGPRFLILVPLFGLLVCAAIFSRRSLIPATLTLLCALGPFMGFCVPWRSLLESSERGPLTLRVVTLNPGGGVDWEHLERYLTYINADVIAFQEVRVSAKTLRGFPKGWFVTPYGELMVASRFPIVQATSSREDRNVSVMRCDLETDAGIVHLCCLHLHTVRDGLDAILERWGDGAAQYKKVVDFRNDQSRVAARFAAAVEGPTVVLGDFNLTPDSPTFRGDWGAWKDAFKTCGWGLGFTFGTRRGGVRIDHILADPQNWTVRDCNVGPDIEGQHRPVFAELELRKTGAGSGTTMPLPAPERPAD